MNHFIGRLEHVAKHWKLALLLLGLLLIFSIESPPPASMEARVNHELAHKRFNFVGWEIRTVWQKLEHGLVSPQHYTAEEDRHDFLLDYLDLVAQTHRLEGEIHTIYVDPDIDDAHEATAELRARRDELRHAISARQSTAEAILEEQVASVLEGEGFGMLGQELPPVAVHFTPLPRFLIISPRDRIETVHQLSLTHGLGVAEQEEIEEQIDAAFDVSSLVTAIGGLSAYPSMVVESSSINWITEVIAHEWTHHYLAPRPLGRKYAASGETRRINETVASIVGKEVGRKVVARYYPQHLPPEPEPTPGPEEPGQQDEQGEDEQLQPATFDFRLEMRETRIRVDQLLDEGRIEEAETYMEQRRTLFVEHGYAIRKLNQAYFAFHGAYAAEPGAAGEDPIGPAVQELFARSPDLQTFLNRIATITTLSELETLLDELQRPTAS
ncbi:MAG: hypothetical protein U9R72_14105 [Chloroflexota bacterium]|nr:hypothetical protein [Chloroflexota bacterium]MEA3377320.1 hypothetical protein [Chloroflexota bacterium]